MPEPKNIKSLINQVMSELDGYDGEEGEEEEIVEYDKKDLIRDIKQLNLYNNNLHESFRKLNDTLKRIRENSKKASHHLVREVEMRDPFASTIVKENAKKLKQLSEDLQGTMEAIYEPAMKSLVTVEEIGHLLDRYYKIDEIIDEISDEQL